MLRGKSEPLSHLVGKKIRFDYRHQGRHDAESGRDIEGWVVHQSDSHINLSARKQDPISDISQRARAKLEGTLKSYDLTGIASLQVVDTSHPKPLYHDRSRTLTF